MPRELNEHEYKESLRLAIGEFPFYAIVAAAMRQADTDNLKKLKAAFPGIWESLLEWVHKPIWRSSI